MIELEHSPLGGSGADRWFNCAGSYLLHRELLEAGEIEEIESGFAKLGTAAHELGAKCLIEEREPFEFIGQEIAGYTVGGPNGINPDAVAAYVTICEKIYPRDGKGHVLIEQTLKHPEVHPDLRGTVDFGYWSASRGMWLRDYKNGEGIGVSALHNKQLLYYAYLMVLEYPWLRDSAPDDFRVSLGIVQPNFRDVFDPEDVWEVTLGSVRAWGSEVLRDRMHELTSTKDVSDGDFVPGDHCQFCPVLLDCPKAQGAFQTFVDGTEFPEMLTNAEVDAFYEQKDLARKFMTELDKVAYARAVSGTEFKNAKLVAKKGSRDWTPGAEAALKAAFGDAAYEPASLKSPAVVEKMSSRAKDMVKEWAHKPIVEGLSLVTMSDPRPAAKPKGNADVFKTFEEKIDSSDF